MHHLRIAVIGQGYVGLPVAQAAVQAGHHVTGYDTDTAKVDSLHACKSPIDDITDSDLQAMSETGRYEATSDPVGIAHFDVAIVTVPTPLRDGRPDLTAVSSAAAAVGAHLRPGGLVVLESTVAPGTTGGRFTDLLLSASSLGRGAFHVAFSPERIDPGNTTWTFATTPKLVGGTTPAATATAVAVYRTMCTSVVPVASAEVAELAKLHENTYRHVNCALVNELSRHAKGLGIDVWQVIDAANTKPYGFQAFYPGPGVGGHCLPIDPVYLSDGVERGTGRPFRFVDLAMQVNAAQPAYVVERAAALLNARLKSVNGSTILVLGATYKAGSGDMRESPAVEVVRRLAKLGANVHVCDPHADEQILQRTVALCGATTVDIDKVVAYAALADLVVVLTAHPEFPYHELVQEAALVFDTRRACATHPAVVTL